MQGTVNYGDGAYPQARRIRVAGEDEELPTAGEEDWKARERSLNVELVDAGFI